MTYIPPTRYATLAATAWRRNHPHRIVQPVPQSVELAHRLLNMPVDERLTHVSALEDAAVLDVMIALDLHTGSAYELWHDTPARFAQDVLGLALTSEQRAVLGAVADPYARRIAARIPRPDHDTAAAVLLVWTALVSCPRPYGDVPRVAVSFAQYRHHSDSVWRILARFVDQALLPGRLDLGRRAWWGEDPQRVMAFAVWNTNPDAMAGLDQYVAVAVGADRIADPDMRATMNFLAESVYGGSRLVALADEDGEPEEWFELFESCDLVAKPAVG
ncbi:hypothetical protein [Streptomyces griseomycini]|uniref:Uncharacterized protein n=1 Tax=Streptomyces griseomycini TaxID=66895 RepID=A0A7W7PWG2_9ACTN|nr:hypothetical protein [Streptomyces griseomycini]MBB4902572.1 hypothetical protein [Streptomyces griseomycini]GGR54243.1 hypothetical protein GCM10015536_69430 [Streptomyces griseomycini]